MRRAIERVFLGDDMEIGSPSSSELCEKNELTERCEDRRRTITHCFPADSNGFKGDVKLYDLALFNSSFFSSSAVLSQGGFASSTSGRQMLLCFQPN